jgi:hypothetical protein
MKPDKVPIPDVQTLKFRRDELFRDFEDRPGKLKLAREIKDIDDQIVCVTAPLILPLLEHNPFLRLQSHPLQQSCVPRILPY